MAGQPMVVLRALFRREEEGGSHFARMPNLAMMNCREGGSPEVNCLVLVTAFVTSNSGFTEANAHLTGRCRRLPNGNAKGERG